MSEIKGYKPLNDDQRAFINELKELEQIVLAKLKEFRDTTTDIVDPRWMAIARTHLELAFMAAVRSIAKPETLEF